MTNSSSGGSRSTSSGSGQDQAVDLKKRKRMQSNRESAQRSRLRKQKHLDDLVTQVEQLRKENAQIVSAINFTTQQYLRVEAENSVLRTQMAELSNRLQSLYEILSCVMTTTTTVDNLYEDGDDEEMMMMMRPGSNLMSVMDMYQYC